MSEAIDVRFKQPLARCPYCHDDCREDAAVVACRACLARHHADCWDQLTRCGACGEERALRESARSARVDPDQTVAQIQDAVSVAASELGGVARAAARLLGPVVARWTIAFLLGLGASVFALAPVVIAAFLLARGAAITFSGLTALSLVAAGCAIPAWGLYAACRDHLERTAPRPRRRSRGPEPLAAPRPSEVVARAAKPPPLEPSPSAPAPPDSQGAPSPPAPAPSGSGTMGERSGAEEV